MTVHLNSQAQKPERIFTTGQTVLEAIDITKRFGDFTALESVSLQLKAGSIHALLGENGAGKSTLVKCIMGYYQPTEGQIAVAGHEQTIRRSQDATMLGIGMVYQHFTVIDNMTVLENMVLARPQIPAFIHWKKEAQKIEQKMAQMPFHFDLNRKVSSLSAGEKQKLEIIKQLLLNVRILILDEPTSVLTPNEADEILIELRNLTKDRGLAVLMITHKFREVTEFADYVTVLRKGQWVGSRRVSETNTEELSALMIGSETTLESLHRQQTELNSQPKVEFKQLTVLDDQGLVAVDDFNLSIHGGEIIGIAGVSGNGQSQLMAALSGQRDLLSGSIQVDGQPFKPTRKLIEQHRVYCVPEEPLRNACVADMSVAENLALRNYDQAPFAWFKSVLNMTAIKQQALQLIEQFNVKTQGADEAIGNLSGGNVQRAVLARELSRDVNVLLIANPCFGLDFKAVSFIRNLIMETRNQGAAVLLVSEDLDEILQLSDRFYVMSKGKLVMESTAEQLNLTEIGKAMAGHYETEEVMA